MSTIKRKVESDPKQEDVQEEKPSVIETPDYNDAKVRKQVKKSADAKLFDALAEVGFHPNEWHFEPKYIRYLLQVGTLSFGLFTVVALIQGNTTVFGTYFWMFISYLVVFAGLLYFWYYSIEHGGGKFLFSPGWRDSYVVSKSTTTNYVVNVFMGFDDEVSASIPYTAFEFEADKCVDHYWLADALEEQFETVPLLKK